MAPVEWIFHHPLARVQANSYFSFAFWLLYLYSVQVSASEAQQELRNFGSLPFLVGQHFGNRILALEGLDFHDLNEI